MKRGISTEVKRQFRIWYERNLAGIRSGLIGGVEYRRAGALDDIPGDDTWYANAYDRAVLDYTEPASPAEEDFIRSHPLIVLQLLLGLTDMRGIRCMRRGLTRHINSLQLKSYRSRYYEKDNRRRRILAAARRKIHRRTTLNPCPSADEFRAAFASRNDSVEARIRFGGMVHDLECYVDNCLRIDESGEIVGRNGGVKHWLADNVPELYERYKTIMRYKALVKRIRQAVQVRDPIPTSDLLEVGRVTVTGTTDETVLPAKHNDNGHGQSEGEKRSAPRDCVATASEMNGATHPMAVGGGEPESLAGGEKRTVLDAERGRRIEAGRVRKDYYAIKSHSRVRIVAAGRVKNIFEGCGNTMVGVFRAVDWYLDKHFDRICGNVAGSPGN